MVHIVYGLLITLLLAASSVNALTIDLGPSDYRNWGSGSFQHHPFGDQCEISGQDCSMPPMHVLMLPEPVPSMSIANGMFSFLPY